MAEQKPEEEKPEGKPKESFRNKAGSWLKSKAAPWLKVKVASPVKSWAKSKVVPWVSEQAGMKGREEETYEQAVVQAIQSLKTAQSVQERKAALEQYQLARAQLEEIRARRAAIARRNAMGLMVAFIVIAGIVIIFLAATGHLGPFSGQFMTVYGTIFSYLGSYISPLTNFFSSGLSTLQCVTSNPLACINQPQAQVTYSWPSFPSFTQIQSYTAGEPLILSGTSVSRQYFMEVEDTSIFGENGCESLYGDVGVSPSLQCSGSFICDPQFHIVSVSSGSLPGSLCPSGALITQNTFVSFSCPQCPNHNPLINETFCQNGSNPFPLDIPLMQSATISAAAVSILNIEVISQQLYDAFMSNQLGVPFSGGATEFSTSGPVTITANLLVPNPIVASSSGGVYGISISVGDSDLYDSINYSESSLCVFVPQIFQAYTGTGTDWGGGAPSTEGLNIELPSGGGSWYCANNKYLVESFSKGLPVYFEFTASPPSEGLNDGYILVVFDYVLTENFPSYVVVESASGQNPCHPQKSSSG